MRNSEAQRYARWSAAVALLIALGVTGVYMRRAYIMKQEAKKAPASVPATVEQQSNEFSYSKVEGQRTIYTVKASRATQFKEGNRNLLEEVSISVFGKKGERNDLLRTRSCDFISDTGKISCAGEVQISLRGSGASPAEAIEIVTSGVSFEQRSGVAGTEKPVTFQWPSGEGRAVGVRYDSSDGVLLLKNKVEMSISVSAPGISRKAETSANAVNLTGSTLTFERESHVVQVQGDVHAQQTTHDLSADKLLLNLDSSFHVKQLIATGHPQLRDSDAHGPTSLDADEISAELRPDGSVESIVADGNVHGSRKSPTGEDGLEAARVKMDLTTRQNAPRLLTANGSVTLLSHAATAAGGTRRVVSDAVEIHFSSPSGNDTRPGPAVLESVNTLAPAHIEWDNLSIAAGKPVKQTMRMNGKQMNLRFDGQNQLQSLTSSGGVDVTRRIGDEPEQTTASRELSAKFSGAGEWSTVDQVGDVRFHEGLRGGQADRARLDRATNTTTLTGSVLLTDSNMRTTAQTATFTQASNQLKADGNVLTTELRAGTGGIVNFAPEPAHVAADHMLADTAHGHAIYSGNGRLWQGQSVIQAETIELDNPSQTVVARGHVQGVFPQAAWSPLAGQTGMPTTNRTGSRTATQPSPPQTELGHVWGGLLTYWETESRARIEQNARADSVQGSIQANQIDLFFSTTGAVNATKQLSRAVASGDVTVRQEDRRGTSNRAEYTASEGKFVLSEGKPTIYDSDGDTTTGRQLTFYFADDRIVVDSEAGARTVTLHRVEK